VVRRDRQGGRHGAGQAHPVVHGGSGGDRRDA
jgi:hypothetical protein